MSAVPQADNHQKSQAINAKSGAAERKGFQEELSHDQIVSLTDQFMDTILQETDETNKVVQFDTKAGLLNEFTKITTKEVASGYVDFYFREESDGLYIKPTETPPWFQESNGYDMIQKDNKTMKVVQENTTALYGTYTIKLEFTWQENQWYITNIIHE
ncbi:hypothetical protein [Lentibacillus sp. CBA3610]|uniref:hypothetical protein n=1 Tax=Lentibacillus sp. CBA3610 TaxID=2518176 RepID=UPI00159529BD|nr:hypothetical protein [Lentibacillus sp. CBA3610]QKY69757.1 hypothetical protein Len3610_09255 [Lentibacillus sp. CBA3610]